MFITRIVFNLIGLLFVVAGLFFTATCVAGLGARGVWVGVGATMGLDALFRLVRGGSGDRQGVWRVWHLLLPRSGGHVMFIPVWLIGGFSLVCFHYAMADDGLDRAKHVAHAPTVAPAAPAPPAPSGAELDRLLAEHDRVKAAGQGSDRPDCDDGSEGIMFAFTDDKGKAVVVNSLSQVPPAKRHDAHCVR